MQSPPFWSNSMDIINEYLYLGDIKAANNLNLLRSRSITHVLAVYDGTIPMHKEHFIYK